MYICVCVRVYEIMRERILAKKCQNFIFVRTSRSRRTRIRILFLEIIITVLINIYFSECWRRRIFLTVVPRHIYYLPRKPFKDHAWSRPAYCHAMTQRVYYKSWPSWLQRRHLRACSKTHLESIRRTTTALIDNLSIGKRKTRFIEIINDFVLIFCQSNLYYNAFMI